MKNIYILEHFDLSKEQLKELKKLGNVHYFQKAEQKYIDEAIEKADVILFDWLDPTDLMTKLHKGQMVCLPFTGFGWIKTLNQAIDNGVVVCNTPNYSTNAVAEHHLALMLSACKQVAYFNNLTKARQDVSFHRGIEITGKKVGIIGLGHIGFRLAELLKSFNVELYTYNNTKKSLPNIKDVSLEKLLKTCDFVCVTCVLNDNTRNMLNYEKLSLMKNNAILTQTTGGIIDFDALDKILSEGKLFGVGLDDVDQQIIPKNLFNYDRLICTYHRAFDTNESEKNRLDMCISNIKAYFDNNPINLIELKK